MFSRESVRSAAHPASLHPGRNTHTEKGQPEQQHDSWGKQVVSRVVTGMDVADPHKRVAALGDDAHWNDERQVAIEVSCSHKEQDGQRQIENTGDLDLSDVQWRPTVA